MQLCILNINKAAGPDGLPNWLLRDFAPYLSQPLAAIFNDYSSWLCTASLEISGSDTSTELPRSRSVQTDLRPILLLPSLAKVVESIIGQWLLPVLEPALIPNQFGSRRQKSTTHALVAMTGAWQFALNRGGAARARFVDFKKAFDSVNHNLSLRKLHSIF